jgi:hypothetical protein
MLMLEICLCFEMRRLSIMAAYLHTYTKHEQEG